jgi:hypothetical protein
MSTGNTRLSWIKVPEDKDWDDQGDRDNARHHTLFA